MPLSSCPAMCVGYCGVRHCWLRASNLESAWYCTRLFFSLLDVVHGPFYFNFGEAVHKLPGLSGGLEYLRRVEMDLGKDKPLSGQDIGWPHDHTTGVSNSYSAFHLPWPGAMTSISL
jgi:hypothetical protein